MRLPSPTYVPINISVTMIITRDKLNAVLSPTKICGNVSQKETNRKICKRVAPIKRTASVRDFLVCMTPYAVLKMIMRPAANAVTAIFELSSIPKTNRNRGNMAVAGIDLKKSITNSKLS